MIELRHLKTLSALRDSGSLVEAAERIHLTQSALSHQIKDLEDRLNCSLFVRKTKPIRFTGAGQRMLVLADEILPMVRNTERDIARLASGETGRLNICVECHSCFDWLIPALDYFRQHWPEVELDLSGGFNFRPLPALLKGDLDLVVTADPEPINKIVYVPLFSYESRLAVNKQHILTTKQRVQPQDLEDETLITYPVEPQKMDIYKHFLEPATVKPAAIRTAELTVMILQLVASGRGVAALPNWVLAEYQQRDYIASLSLGDEGVWCVLYAAIREEQQGSEFISDFLSIAKEVSFQHLEGIRPV